MDDLKSTFLGLNVRPVCRIARLRMARARRLGADLADRLHASGAAEILAEIRAGTTSSTQAKEKEEELVQTLLGEKKSIKAPERDPPVSPACPGRPVVDEEEEEETTQEKSANVVAEVKA